MTVHLFTFVSFILANIHIIGPVLMVLALLALIYWNRQWLKSQSDVNTTEFVDAESTSYVGE